MLTKYEKKNPNAPWLTSDAIDYLNASLKNSDIYVEWGSGRSTAWFAERVGHVTSVESDREWHQWVAGQLKANESDNVTYYLREDTDDFDPNRPEIPYVAAATVLDNESVDVALVDGIFRAKCALAVIGKLRRGGILIVDNVNWFLPSATRSPASVGLGQEPASEDWKQFAGLVSNWSVKWTSNGVWDTAIWTKPN